LQQLVVVRNVTGFLASRVGASDILGAGCSARTWRSTGTATSALTMTWC